MKLNQNQNRVSILERVKMNTLLKKLSLTQLYVLRELTIERIDRLERKIFR